MHRTSDGRTSMTRDDHGSALIITLMVMALVTALATTVSVVAINNLQSSWRSQQAGSALNAADAGVAQAMTYLRTSGVRDLRCSPSCGSNPWGNQASPVSVSLPGAARQAYRVWIGFAPGTEFPTSDPGLYVIHSTGTAAGAASRSVTLEVGVSTLDVPQGVFARSIHGGGDATVAHESIFSTGCVYSRSKIEMVEGQIDLAYGIPIGVHTSQFITESNGSTQYCPESDKKLIHRQTNGQPRPCNPSYPFDQDNLGGAPTCAGAAAYPDHYGTRDLDGDGTADVRGSYLEDDAALFDLFDLKTPGLSQVQVDRLRATAQTQGNYWTSSAGWTSPDEANAVMFFDLAGTDLGGTVNLSDIVGFTRGPNLQADHASCPSRSLVVVVEGGNARLNSNQRLYASIFLTGSAPNGTFRANGTSLLVGTVFADTVSLSGTADFSMDPCFRANSSPTLLDLRTGVYREIDRGLS
jgi:Tfp pilus assembly protein PilX